MFKKILYPALFITIFLSFNFQSNPPFGWYEQSLPPIGIRSITSIDFIDSLNGFLTVSNFSQNDTGFILKTTNGGNNWITLFIATSIFSAIEFINLNTGFVCGGTLTGPSFLYKTTNSGINWFSVNCPATTEFDDIKVLNKDTIFLIEDEFPTQMGLYRTLNGGDNWTKFTVGTNPDKIYMFNNSIGFVMCNEPFGEVYKTTNGGNNWIIISPPNEGAYDIKFVNTLTGWKSWSSKIQKTTNGGLDWIDQILPSGGGILINRITEIALINKDTLWAVGATKFYSGYGNRGILLRTTNSGNNWHYQTPNLNINFENYYYCEFLNKNIGWAYNLLGGIHTTTGGDSNFVTNIGESISINNYKLYQNYPNPFNPVTRIKFELSKQTNISLIIYDILGKEITRLINNQSRNAGINEIVFNGNGLTSGIYFYKLISDNFTEYKKMLLLK